VLVLVGGLAVATVALFTRAPAPDAHNRLRVEPQMTKGPATAPVTIVEFSDYQ
jgi:protein-disulfide isomerase